MKKFILLSIFLCTVVVNAQIKGKVTDTKGNPLVSVGIYLDKTVTGTTTNNNGEYVLAIKKLGNYTVVFQFLGFKTQKKQVKITSFPYQLNVVLEEEKFNLDEVIVSTKGNPANQIIKKAIAFKDKNTNKRGNYTANFYSRGLFKVKNAPKKILGQDLGDLGGALDSTRSGIVYLSETISEITYQKKPSLFKEKNHCF